MPPGAADQPAAADREIDTTAGKPLYALEADDFAATVLDGAPPVKSAEQTIATMAALDQMRATLGVI